MPIAFDAQANNNGSGTSMTYAHTCAAGSVLFVGSLIQSGLSMTSITYNGVTLTDPGLRIVDGGGYEIYMWYSSSPSSGSNNIVITPSASTVAIFGRSASYTGVNTSSVLGATSTASKTSTTTHTYSLTTNNNNSWTLLFARGRSEFIVASTGSTRRSPPTGTNSDTTVFDSNAAITPAGSNSMSFTCSPATASCGIMWEVNVASSTTVKSYLNGTVTANVKTVLNGTAIASRKTWNGIA